MNPKSPNFDYYFDIDTENGKVFWKNTVSKYHRELVGKEAGLPANSRGKDYWVIRLNKKAYKRSHIIFWKLNGRMPEKIVDHIDGNSLNDAGSNLREVSFQVNSQNRKVGYRGKELPLGVRKGYTNKQGKSHYVARIRHHYKSIYLGSFATPEEASAAYQLKQKEFI